MAYKKDKNEGGSRYSRRQYGLNTKEDNPSRGITASNYEFYELEPAEVIDIILNESHPDFEGYEDIGKAKIRFVISENGKDKDILRYAKPLDSNIKNFPLLHEVVIAVTYLDDLYYTQRLNVFNNVNENSYLDVSLPFAKPKGTTKGNAQEYEQVSTSGNPNRRERRGVSLGKTFLRNELIRPLQPFEGDIIFEGRFGESIRFGSNTETGNPTMKIRVGQPTDVPDEILQTIVEDINLDQNSIWVGTDEELPLNPATIQSSVHLQFYDDKPNEFIGNQILMNSDRIVLNTKQNEFMTFAKKAINMVTSGVVTIDAQSDMILNTATSATVNSPQIFLGSSDATEPIILGDTLIQLLNELIDYLVGHTHSTGVGPSGTPLPPQLNQLQQLKNKLNSAKSRRNFSL